MQELAQNHGLIVSYYPSGPLLEYMPDAGQAPPKTAAELLDWTKQNKNKFMYARPAELRPRAGPGSWACPISSATTTRMDPVNGWDKTWDYLKALGETSNTTRPAPRR